MDTATEIEGVLAGRRRSLARLLSAVEAGEEQTVREVVAALHPHTGRAHTIGVTGSPGVGKSTLTGQLVAEQRRRGRRVAVLAVDPSSPFSGGALLGDRVRMADQVMDDGVYIRSMASRGHLGGLSWATPQAVTVMDAAGFDVVVVETVGVGQAEVEIASLADSTVVALAPGMGDAVQAAKAGILEVADVFVVNKADREGAERTVRELQGMLDMTADPDGWTPPILRTVASRGEGVDAVADALDRHLTWASDGPHRQARRRTAARVQVREIVLAAVRRRMRGLGDGEALEAVLDDVVARRTDPYSAADSLLDRLGTETS
ncbi:methylmalonyl Co-A mutase-associated GTPase MeaB [Euzebya sp.]|uniref:methylmalonyl Co-A mutase-associated GTPase MeaB n=1 Tax=Euzebya sp. TaxID=1971409 RepID=UPI0035189CCF